MADIKTRNAVEGRVKTIDRALIAGQHIKQSYLSTRDESLRYAGTSKNTEVEYATNQVEQKQKKLPWMECINSIKADEMVLMSLRVT